MRLSITQQAKKMELICKTLGFPYQMSSSFMSFDSTGEIVFDIIIPDSEARQAKTDRFVNSVKSIVERPDLQVTQEPATTTVNSFSGAVAYVTDATTKVRLTIR